MPVPTPPQRVLRLPDGSALALASRLPPASPSSPFVLPLLHSPSRGRATLRPFLRTRGGGHCASKVGPERELADQDHTGSEQTDPAAAIDQRPPERTPPAPIAADRESATAEKSSGLNALLTAAADGEELSASDEAGETTTSRNELTAHTATAASVRSVAPGLQDSAATAPATKGDGIQPQNDSILRVLSRFDEPLLKVLEGGTIRILSSEWLARQPVGCRIERMQDLAARQQHDERPFLEPKAAADLVRQRGRALGVLSYPWLSADHPDPAGDRMRAVRRALEHHPHISGLFWDYASLPQKPRSKDEEEVFRVGLSKISDLYASAIGTTVLRSTFIPECPSELQGVFRLEGARGQEAQVRSIVQGCIPPCTVMRIKDMTNGILHVLLDTPPSQAGAESLSQSLMGTVCDRAVPAYNARLYDDRGWCFFESVVSSELLGRLNPKVRAALASLPSKVIEVEADGRTKAVVDWLTGDFAAEIARKTFTGKGDAELVTELYFEYFERIAKGVASTLHLSVEEEHGAPAPLPPLPALPELPSPSFRLKRGQYVLCRDALASQPAVGTSEPLPHLVPRLHWVTDDAEDVCRLGIHGGSTAADINRVDHRALPWLRSAQRYGHTAMKWHVAALDAAANRMAGVAVHTEDGHSTKAHAIELPPALQLQVINAMCAAAAALAELNCLADMLKHSEETKPDGRGAQEHMNAERRIHRKIVELERQKVMADFTEHIRNVRGRTMVLAAPTLDLGTEQPTASDLHDARAAMVEAMANAFQILGRAGREAVADVFQIIGEAGRRQYATQQRLLVRVDGEWVEAEVIGHEALEHLVRMADESQRRVLLDPWNHAPLEVPLATFDKLRAWWMKLLAAQHSCIVDVISGKRLHVLDQCVSVTIDGVDAGSTQGASGVHQWVLCEHARLCNATRDAVEPACLLITAGPAAGKTTLTSQLVMLLKDGPLVPILVRGQKWQRILAERRDVFAAAWNWVDAYVQVEYEQQPAVVGMLRQAMRSRRAVLLLDGLDECGSMRWLFEAHIGGMLLSQGHVVVALSRPAGLGEASLRAFRRASLLPLSEAQQQHVLKQRIPDAAERAKLWSYIVERLPRDAEGERITSNPLMLSMLASIAELRVGREMPRSVADLYTVATDAMLVRAKAGTEGSVLAEPTRWKLSVLLRKLFLQAQLAQQRIIGSELINSAIGKDAPWLIECILNDRVALLSLLQAEPLEVQAPHLSFQEFMAAVAIADGAELPVQTVEQLSGFWANTMRLGAGLGERFGNALAEQLGLSSVEEMKVHSPANVVACCAALGAVLQSTTVRVKEIRFGDHAINDSGLKELFAVIPFKGALKNVTELHLSNNKIGDEGMKAFVDALSKGAINNIIKLHLYHNQIGDEGMTVFAEALSKGALNNLKNLRLNETKIGEKGMKAFTKALSKGALINLTELRLFSNKIGDEGMKAFSQALSKGAMDKLMELYLRANNIGDEGMKAFAEALSMGALNNLQNLVLANNKIDNEGMKALAEAISKGALNNLENLSLADNHLGAEGMIALANTLSKGAMAKLTDLWMSRRHALNMGSHFLREACITRNIKVHQL